MQGIDPSPAGCLSYCWTRHENNKSEFQEVVRYVLCMVTIASHSIILKASLETRLQLQDNMYTWTSKQQCSQSANFHEVLTLCLHAMFIDRWKLGSHTGRGLKKGGVSLCNKQTNNNNNSDNINFVIVR